MTIKKSFLMPSMGEGIEEATLVKWLKNVGDKVLADEPLLEVSTDKVDTEIPSPFNGTVGEIHYQAGDKVRVHESLAEIILDASEINEIENPKNNNLTKTLVDTKKNQDINSQNTPINKPIIKQPSDTKVTQNNTNNNIFNNQNSTPIVRKIADEYNINLDLVPGTGLNQKITKSDLYTYLTNLENSKTKPNQAPVYDGSNPVFKLKTQIFDDIEKLDGVSVKREKMSKIRQLTAEHMNRSIRTSPHVTTVFEIDMYNVVSARNKVKDSILNSNNIKITYTHFISYAAVQTIKEFPIVNVSVDGDDILFKEDINLGLAVAIDSGLIVPVVKNTQQMSFLELAGKIDDIVKRARSKKLLPEDVRGGTFSITNPGLYGSLTSNPIINQPQVAILGIGQIVERPVVLSGQVVIRPMMLASLTFDHRVIDGEQGAKYLASFKQNLENNWEITN